MKPAQINFVKECLPAAVSAGLIRNNYRSAWQVSNDPQAYAKEIAYSPYISELNGDNRETYRHSIIQITQTIQAVMALIGE